MPSSARRQLLNSRFVENAAHDAPFGDDTTAGPGLSQPAERGFLLNMSTIRVKNYAKS
jgi:hypothetical protein